MTELVIGTRGSRLALVQAGWVADRLRRAHPGLAVRVEVICTKGDAVQDVPLPRIGDKGLFTREIEAALLAGSIDLAVHSLKDLPTDLPPGLTIGAVTEREDPRDAIVSLTGVGLEALPPGARVGTSSLRRAAQLRARRPDLATVDIRGNVDTRLRKLSLDGSRFDAIVLAAAGLRRLGLGDRVTEYLPIDIMIPAVGQGALAVEARSDDQRVLEAIAALEHRATRLAVEAERAFLRALGGGCQTPAAAHADLDGDSLRLRGMVVGGAAPGGDGSGMRRGEVTGPAEQGRELGRKLARRLTSTAAAKRP